MRPQLLSLLIAGACASIGAHAAGVTDAMIVNDATTTNDVLSSGLGTEGAGQWLPDAVIAVSGPGHWYERRTAPMRRVHLGLETWVGRMALRWSFRTRIGTGCDLLPVSPVEVAGAIAAPLLVVHGDADPYFGLEHPRMIAAVAPRADLWIERGMGHGETAMIPALLDRIDDWARTAVGAGSATMAE